MKVTVSNIIIPLNSNQNEGLLLHLVNLGFKRESIKSFSFSKRSIDSRKKSEIKLVYNLDVEIADNSFIPSHETIKILEDKKPLPRVNALDKNSKIAVVGTGPAGLFAAYNLCKLGYSPLIFERGEKVDERDASIDTFVRTGVLNPDSNIQFGEGGAGTYSDGKLNTRIKSGYIDEVFQILLASGASEEIMWDYKPHIGTDVLKVVVKNLRNKIIEMGGKFFFSSKLTDITIKNGAVSAIEITSNGTKENFSVEHLVLAIGHSSRETYKMLHGKGVAMENKPFAIGTRIEHSREYINRAMFGSGVDSPNRDLLGTATYSLTHNNRAENRGIFSFCMCPGGVIVNAASELGGTLVNGMSYSDRMRPFSNSALVVAVKENEFGDELFSGLKMQEKFEQGAYKLAGGYAGLYQNTSDFMKNKVSREVRKSSYEMPLVKSDLNTFLPSFITDNMKSALNYWDKIYKGFIAESHLIGPETRTSAPVKINRDLKGESISLRGLYPIGEGAGYAGGITSAAVDGLKVIDLAFSTEI